MGDNKITIWGYIMVIDLYILGCLKEKALNLDFLTETADFIKLNRWTHYKKELLLDRINTLEELNYIEIVKNIENKRDKNKYLATKEGIMFFKRELEKYIKGPDIHTGMLILLLSFSNHFSKDELVYLLKEKIERINQKIEFLTREINKISAEYGSIMGHLSLKTTLSFSKSEILIYEELLNHIEENENWKNSMLLESINF